MHEMGREQHAPCRNLGDEREQKYNSVAIHHPVLEGCIRETYSHPAAISSRGRQDGHLSCGKRL